MLGASQVQASVIGVAVDAIGSVNAPVGSTQFRSALGGDAIKYLIPLSASSTPCTFGVDCGTTSDSGSGGTLMSMFLRFDPISTSHASILDISFEDLDLIGINDPANFLESVEVFNSTNASLTGLIDDISSGFVTGDSNTQQLLSLDLGILSSTTLWLELQFSASYDRRGTNTPEYLIASVHSVVSEPSIIALFALGLFGVGFARRGKHS